MNLTALAPGKVNLCLFVGPARADGRHEVVTLLESVSLADELSITARDDGGSDEVSCPGVRGVNIVSRALEALRSSGWSAPPVRVEISKRIPVAAGMGGGSADAGAALRLAQRLAPVSELALAELAARLGADVPSQLKPGLAIGTGAGDEVEPLAPLAPHAAVIFPQDHHVSAAEVYAEADRLGLPRTSADLERLRRELWAALEAPDGEAVRLPRELLVNDLEPAAISLCPDITGALDAVRGAGADHTMVSGSGPTVVGLFWGPDGLDRAAIAAASLDLSASSAFPVGPDFGHPLHSAQSAD